MRTGRAMAQGQPFPPDLDKWRYPHGKHGTASRAAHRRFLAFLLLCALGAIPLQAQKDPFITSPFGAPNQLILPETISLEIASSELNRGPGDQAFAVLPTAPIDQPVATRIRRTIPALWQYLLPENGDPNAVDIALEMVALSGEADRLSMPGGALGWIAIKLESTTPVLVSKTKRGQLLEGGVIMELDLANARQAGTYLGTLTVTLHNL